MAKPTGINKHYEKVIGNLARRKDSVFESAQVTSFDTKTLTAEVMGLRTRQRRENVLVLFPSLFLNTGIISFPVKGSIGLLFIGADNAGYLMPAQFIEPKRTPENSRMKLDASPTLLDPTLSLEHLEPGEHLIRSLSGAQLMVKNSGEVELSTSKLHKLFLNENRGLLHSILEREQRDIGYCNFYNGTADADPKFHHISASIYEESPFWDTDEVLSKEFVEQLLKEEIDLENMNPERPIPQFTMQFANVFTEIGKRKKGSVDDSFLFGHAKLFDGLDTRTELEISKKGSIFYQIIRPSQAKNAIFVNSLDYRQAKIEKENKTSSAYQEVESIKAYVSEGNVTTSVEMTKDEINMTRGVGLPSASSITLDNTGEIKLKTKDSVVTLEDTGEIKIEAKESSISLSDDGDIMFGVGGEMISLKLMIEQMRLKGFEI